MSSIFSPTLRRINSYPNGTSITRILHLYAHRSSRSHRRLQHRCLSFTSVRYDSANTGTNTFGSTLPEVLHHGGWEGAWKHNIIPWDAGKAAPILQPLLTGTSSTSDNETTVTSTATSSSSSLPILEPLPFGKVLVPGAGSSYDALEFAKAGYPTTAIDIAPTAIDRALTLIQQYNENHPATATTIHKLLTIQQADFFKLEPGATYSVIFDYTFLCALPKPLWSLWARTVTRLIHPEGELISLIFPIGDYTGGPPFAMTPTTVRDLLLPLGWEETLLIPIPSEYSHKPRQNREYLGRYRLQHSRYPIIRTDQPKVPYRRT